MGPWTEAIAAKLTSLKVTALGRIQLFIKDNSNNRKVLIITRSITMRIRAIRTSISQGMVIMAKSFNPTQTRIIRKNISEKSTTKPETLSKHYHPPTTTYPMRRARASTVQILRRTPSLTTTRLYLWSRTVQTSFPTSTTRIATSV